MPWLRLLSSGNHAAILFHAARVGAGVLLSALHLILLHLVWLLAQDAYAPKEYNGYGKDSYGKEYDSYGKEKHHEKVRRRHDCSGNKQSAAFWLGMHSHEGVSYGILIGVSGNLG